MKALSCIRKKTIPQLLLCVALSVCLAACASRAAPTDRTDPDSGQLQSAQDGQTAPPAPAVSKYVFVNTLKEPPRPVKTPKLVESVEAKHKINADTVGWLKLPGTHIDDVVLHNDDPEDFNNYYYRRDFNKQYSFNGCFYADFRNKFGEGKKDELSNNTVIYGHTMSEDINGVMFAPLKNYENEEFAKQNPYIFFSTRSEDLVWEVFSVFYATVSLPYNLCGQSEAEFGTMLKECTDRSIFKYDTQVTGKDKILTLSTCTYYIPGVETRLPYPNDYRYVVMAKLVNKADATKTEASFTRNPAPKAP